MVPEIWEVHPDALPDGDVEKVAAVDLCFEDLGEHDPPARVEPGFQAVVRFRGQGASPPRSAHRAEPEVAGDVIREELLGDQPRRPVR
jgi:hypothetical protein